jgi:hypothetical protein
MTKFACTEEHFLNDIKKHSMSIRKDEGMYRHLTFTNNDSSFYQFDLITWPGHLTISGDMGTYTFACIPDMFDFFGFQDFFDEQPTDFTFFGDQLIDFTFNYIWRLRAIVWGISKYKEVTQ